MRSRPVEMAFDDVRRVLEDHDWTFHRQKGSHAIFVKAGERSLTIPRHGGRSVKRVYLDFICKRLGLDDEYDSD
ncbi:MAG: type II toxin-antitoxin system HicA family toxin [Thermomicrobiales bacterium]